MRSTLTGDPAAPSSLPSTEIERRRRRGNAGPSTAADVVVSDTLPPEVGFVAAAGTGWACSEAAGTLTCLRASLAVGPAPPITVTVTAPTEGGALLNAASVSAATADPDQVDNDATETTQVSPAADLDVTARGLFKSGDKTQRSGFPTPRGT